jgi:hypothetical protein
MRSRWRALVLLVVLVGAVGGLSISLIAGARRSATVVDRYLATARPYDFELFAPALSREQVAAIPGVQRADARAFVGMAPARKPRAGWSRGINGYAMDFDTLDPTTRLLRGRIPDGSDPRAVVVNEGFVKALHRSVGDSFEVRMFGLDQGDEVSRGVYHARGPRYRLHIVGVVRPSTDVATDEVRSVDGSSGGAEIAMMISRPFYEQQRHSFLDFGESFGIQLSGGLAARRRLMDAVNAMNPPGANPPVIGPYQSSLRRSSLATPVDLETTVLLVLGISLAIAGVVVVGILLRAQQRGLDHDTPALRTLGLTRRDLGAVAVLRTVPVGVAGAVLAVAVAIGLSGRYPIGIGRELELHDGISANVAVLALGALAILLVVIVLGFVLGLPRRDRRALPSTRRTFARTLAAGGAPTDLVLGTQLLFERGRAVRPVPTRAAIAVGALALAVMCGVGVYVGGVDHLYGVRSAHGWDWDVAMGNPNFPLAPATAAATARDPRITHRTLAAYGDATVNGKGTEVLAFTANGDAPPAIVRGRLPTTASEIALGGPSLRRLGVHLGSVVRFSVRGGEFDHGGKTSTRRMRVVGEGVAPIFGESDVGQVGMVTFAGLKAAGGDTTPQFVLARLRGGAAHVAALRGHYTEELLTDTIPARIVNLHRVRGLPLLGILLAGVLGTIVLVSTLAISGRARARELAVLRALGLPSRRIGAVVAWQGVLLASGMLVIGIPVGLGVGVAGWHRVADGLGVASAATIPLLLLLLIPLALLVGAGASLLPARRARRAPVGDLLRVE